MPPTVPLIAIIEDDELSAFVFEKVLTTHGFAVAINGGDDRDLPALLALQPAALLVDLHLGEMDGVQLLKRLRAVRNLRHVPAAVITGDYFTDAQVSRELEALGIEMYLKPLWEDDLLRVVNGLLKRPSSPRSIAASAAVDGAHP